MRAEDKVELIQNLKTLLSELENDERNELLDIPKTPFEVFWIVSEDGELGVEVNGIPFFYYKYATPLACKPESVKYRQRLQARVWRGD